MRAYDDNGFLLQKPSPNYSIYCYQTVSPKPFSIKDYPQDNLPKELVGYYRKANEQIKSPYPINRLKIPQGQPGYVPEWQRSLLSDNKRKRMRLPKRLRQNDPILGIITIGDDYVVFDLRGLLRVNHWREKSQPEHTIQNLLDHFTCCPIIDYKRNIVRFRYKEEHGIINCKSLNEKEGKELQLNLVKEKGSIKLATIDVGQNNPVAVGIYKITEANGALFKKEIERFSTPTIFLDKIKAHRKRSDDLEAELKKEAIAQLSQEQQKEFQQVATITAQQVADTVCSKLGINGQDLPWDKMTNNTHYISDAFINKGGDKSVAVFYTKDKKTGQEKEIIKSDWKWFCEYKPKLSEETRKEFYGEKGRGGRLGEAKKNSPKYTQLSVSKLQDVRELANLIASKCDVIGIEKEIPYLKRFGSGKREIGWDNFLLPKKENRWWIMAIWGALFDLAQNKGKYVILLPARHTSQTCIGGNLANSDCNYCDKENRNKYNRELFKCIKCGDERNADKEIAVENLARVAITGAALPGPIRERSSDAKKTGGARKRKSLKSEEKSASPNTDEVKEVA